MKKLQVTVGVNEFVKRQTPSSGKTYSPTLSFKDIADHAKIQLEKAMYKKGYREGVLLVQVDKTHCNEFICPFVEINESTKLSAQVVKRRPEEEPYIQLRALSGSPLPTGRVELILYRRDVLKETSEHTTEADWELISFHAIPKGLDEMPMGPVTMMRNQLQLRGGTKAKYPSDSWAKSVQFWQKYAVLTPVNV